MNAILKLKAGEMKTLMATRELAVTLLVDSRVQGESKEAAALRESLRDLERLVCRIDGLAKLPK